MDLKVWGLLLVSTGEDGLAVDALMDAVGGDGFDFGQLGHDFFSIN